MATHRFPRDFRLNKFHLVGYLRSSLFSANQSRRGKVYNQFNAKWLYIGGLVLFEAGSALCGAAPTMNALIGGRVLAGLGGSGVYIGVMTLLSVNTTEHERPMYLGLTGLTWGLGTVLGPVCTTYMYMTRTTH